jgi:hypothetical protein
VNPPLDVLLVSQPVSYGVAIFVRQLTEAAVAAGHRVTVACPGPDRGPLAGWVRRAGAEHRTLNMARQPSPRDVVDLWSLPAREGTRRGAPALVEGPPWAGSRRRRSDGRARG